MALFSMEVPLYLNTSNIRKLITDLLNKNRIFGGAHIRLTVFRNIGDHIIPTGNSVSFLLESSSLEHGKYGLNEKGLTVAISQTFVRNTGRMCAFYRANINLFMLASIEAEKLGVDRMILLNDSGRLTESTDSNIFLVSGNSLFTPSLQQGCIDGVMRKIIVNCGINAGFMVNDQSSLTSASLYDAEELFFTNAIHGIFWAGAFQQKRYFNKTARILTGMLNDLAFE
jgi:branched-chain amino acid aminotransferase